jgi:hypothetical protein
VCRWPWAGALQAATLAEPRDWQRRQVIVTDGWSDGRVGSDRTAMCWRKLSLVISNVTDFVSAATTL